MNIFLKSAGKQEGTSCVSNMVQLGDFFYLSGQTGLGESIQEQTITAINKVIDVLSLWFTASPCCEVHCVFKEYRG